MATAPTPMTSLAPSFDSAVAAQGAARAMGDVRRAAEKTQEIAADLKRVWAESVFAARRGDTQEVTKLALQADLVVRAFVVARAQYDKAVEVAALVSTAAEMARRAELYAASGRAKDAAQGHRSAWVLGEAVRKLGTTKIPIVVPRALSRQAAGLGGLGFLGINFKKLGNWLKSNAGTIAGVAGTVVAGPAGAAVGGALGGAIQGKKQQVQQAAPPADPPAPPAGVPGDPNLDYTPGGTPYDRDRRAPVKTASMLPAFLMHPLFLGAVGVGLIVFLLKRPAPPPPPPAAGTPGRAA